MPTINILYKEEALSLEALKRLKTPIRNLVAEALSVPRYPISPESIKWKPEVLHSEADIGEPVAIEIESTAHEDRLHKLAPPEGPKGDDPRRKLYLKISQLPEFIKGPSFRLDFEFKHPDNRSVINGKIQ